jgi:hypothetical protein
VVLSLVVDGAAESVVCRVEDVVNASVDGGVDVVVSTAGAEEDDTTDDGELLSVLDATELAPDPVVSATSLIFSEATVAANRITTRLVTCIAKE